jgi:hypothetical protein
MSLEEKLNVKREEVAGSASQEVLEIMHRATEDLRASGILDRVLKVGDKAPGFELENAEGRTIGLSDLYSKGPLVLTFFRGRW